MDLEPPEAEDDTTVAGHIMLRQQRQLLYHMRLIEHEMPKLVGESTEHIPLNGFQWVWLSLERMFSF
jgi:small subunit ribosomal protein S35